MKTSFLLLALALSLGAAAQSRPAKPAPQKAAQPAPAAPSASSSGSSSVQALNAALCDCFSSKGELKFESEAAVGAMFGQCMTANPKTGALFMQVIQEKGIAPDDRAAMEAAGRDVGTQLAGSCPVFLQAILRLKNAQTSDSTAKP